MFSTTTGKYPRILDACSVLQFPIYFVITIVESYVKELNTVTIYLVVS